MGPVFFSLEGHCFETEVLFEPRKKGPWLVGLYRGLYYPVIWGL